MRNAFLDNDKLVGSAMTYRCDLLASLPCLIGRLISLRSQTKRVVNALVDDDLSATRYYNLPDVVSNADGNNYDSA